MPLETEKFWAQIERFGKVTFGEKYYRADLCILDVDVPRLISEIRWMPALIPPMQFLNEQDEKVQIVREKLEKLRKRYAEGIPRWYSKKLLRNFEKFLDVLKIYNKDYKVDGYFCIIDELCPNIDEQIKKEIEGFDIPDNFHLLVNYIE